MTVYAIGMQSSQDTPERVRQALSLFQYPGEGGVLGRRGGIVPYPGSADLTSAGGMIGRISSFVGWVDGTTSAAQAGYPFVSDANVDLPFDNGEAGNSRIDRVVAQIRDNAYDASGSTDARVRIVKGQAGGAANAVPASSELLWEVTVPAGASTGSGGINFSTQRSDKRRWTSGQGGALLIKDGTEEASLTPHEGQMIYRTDAKALRVYHLTGWQWIAQAYGEVSGSDLSFGSTGAADVTGMAFTFPAGSIWDYDGQVFYAADQAADLALSWTYPGSGSPSMGWHCLGKESAQAAGAIAPSSWSQLFINSSPWLGGQASNNTDRLTGWIKGRIYAGSVGGTFQLRGAKAVSAGADSKIFMESRMRAKRVG